MREEERAVSGSQREKAVAAEVAGDGNGGFSLYLSMHILTYIQFLREQNLPKLSSLVNVAVPGTIHKQGIYSKGTKGLLNQLERDGSHTLSPLTPKGFSVHGKQKSYSLSQLYEGYWLHCS